MIGFLPGFPCAHHAEPEVDDHESQGHIVQLGTAGSP
jgi:hypothetical protein